MSSYISYMHIYAKPIVRPRYYEYINIYKIGTLCKIIKTLREHNKFNPMNFLSVNKEGLYDKSKPFNKLCFVITKQCLSLSQYSNAKIMKYITN